MKGLSYRTEWKSLQPQHLSDYDPTERSFVCKTRSENFAAANHPSSYREESDNLVPSVRDSHPDLYDEWRQALKPIPRPKRLAGYSFGKVKVARFADEK